jgi:sporulation protein YtfJ
MSEHPIKNLMTTAMENIKGMVDVNAVVGDAVAAPDGSFIIPITKVGFGFAAGGTEFNTGDRNDHAEYPFGGGSGGSVSITPVAFLLLKNGDIRLLSLDNDIHMFDRILDIAPDIVDKIKNAVSSYNKPQ